MRHIILSIIVFICLAKNNANAQYWSALGEGIGYVNGYAYGEGKVYSLAMYNGSLYAAGSHNYNDTTWSNSIVKWNGNNWLTIGDIPGESWINSLLVFNDELYAAGSFSSINGVPAQGIAKWNGTTWSPVGSGISTATAPLIVFNNELYAAGAAGVVKWNGTTWLPVGNILIDYVYSFAVYNGELYATGNNANNSSYYDITKWDGTNWIPLNCQLNEWAWINTMIEYNGDLYAGGNFSSIGGITANHIAKWNGTNWSTVGMGLGGVGSSIQGVFSLTIHKNNIYAAGFFTTTDSTSCRNIAKWDGNSWIGLGNGLGQDFEEEVYSIISDDTVLYAGGNFNTAGNVSARHIAKWTDSCINAPVQPTNILGDIIPCEDTYQTFSVSPVNEAASYTWTLPNGWSGSSLSNTINVTMGTGGGVLSVVANNPCGGSIPQTLFVPANFFIPSQPGAISGNNVVCQGSSQTYSVDAVTGATSYTWTLPSGWTGVSTTNSITTTAGNAGGNILVKTANSCGSSTDQSLAISVNTLPSQPGVISGYNTVCQGSSQTYSVSAVTGATSYTWTLPSGWAGASTTNSITTTAGNAGGNILVKVNSICGSSTGRFLDVRVDSVLLSPVFITGNTTVSVNQKDSYSINQVNGAALYSWSLSGGGSIAAGQNTNSISINWSSPGEYILTVNATNSCGPGSSKSLNIKVSEVKQEDPFAIQLFPNPSHGEFYLKAKGVQDKWLSVEVVSMSGQLMYRSERVLGSNDYTELINMDKMATGLYIVKIIVDEQVFVRKISIIR